MKKITFVIWMCLGLSSFAQAQGDIAQGEAKSATCVTCHNDNGEALGYPKLDGQHASYLEKQLHELKSAMTGGTGRVNAVMGAMAVGLSDEDIADLSAYFASKAMSPNTTAPEYVDAGQALYMGGDLERGIAACTACHGPRGNGQSLAEFPKISSQFTPYLKTQLELFRSGERNNDANGMMRDVAAKLSDKDIELLSQYLGGLH